MSNQSQNNQNTPEITEAHLASLKKAISQAKEIKSRALGQQDTLIKQKDDLVAECKVLGVDPDKVEEAAQANREESVKLYEETAGLVQWKELGIADPLPVNGAQESGRG
jgi:hypothetical protein